MHETCSIDETIFSKPSGSVRGLVTAFMEVKGKSKRVAHATLMVDGPPTVTLEVPKTLPLEQVSVLSDHLAAWAKVVEGHCSVAAKGAGD